MNVLDVVAGNKGGEDRPSVRAAGPPRAPLRYSAGDNEQGGPPTGHRGPSVVAGARPDARWGSRRGERSGRPRPSAADRATTAPALSLNPGPPAPMQRGEHEESSR
jgi:hypothetical protein